MFINNSVLMVFATLQTAWTLATTFISMNLSLYSVAAFLVLDTDGQRVLAKYYRPKHNPLLTPLPDTKQLLHLKEQKAFEKGLWEKTKKPGGLYLHPVTALGFTFCRRRDHIRLVSRPLQALVGSHFLCHWTPIRE
jgi:hypothetical protein